MPIPDLSNKPGPGRPGYGPTGDPYAFQFEVSAGQVGIQVLPNINGIGFTIKWQNGATQIISAAETNLQSPTTQAGIISINKETDKTSPLPLGGFCDNFAVVDGKEFVTKVISWGENPWSNLAAAFDGCTNLTSVSETSLITSDGNLQAIFRNCTGLTEAVCNNWNLAAGSIIADIFNGCTNLTKLDFTGVNIKVSGSSARAFRSIGSTTTDGCEFLFSGLNLSTWSYTGTQNMEWFKNTKIKPTSTFANWSFNPSIGPNSMVTLFESATITGTNSTLDISGWSSYNGNSMSQWFQNFNNYSAVGNTGAKINLTNLSTTNVNSMYFFGWKSGVTELIGLSTLGANTGNTGTINLERSFSAMRFLKLSGSSNFGNAFTSSIKPSTFKSTFRELGIGLTSDYSEAPIFSNMDASSCGTFQNMLQSTYLATMPDFDTVTFPTTAVSFSATFSGITATSYSGSHLDLSNATFKPSTFSSLLSSSTIEKVTFGNNVDLSECTVFTSLALNGGSTTQPMEIILPTNADYTSATSFNTAFQGLDGPSAGNPPLTTCVADTLIRRLFATKLNGALTLNLESSKITEAPSVVQSQLDQLRTAGWNITDNSTDATLPFAYASYAVDPTGITTISPTTTPPAGSVFTATNGLTISSSGVITINTFRGGSTIRCTYPDGCYNEVVMLIQVPFVMRTVIPGLVGSTTYLDMEVKPQMSAGECFVDWGDSNSETLTGNTTHTYASAGTYDIKIFDAASGSKFENFSGYFPTYAGINSATYGSTYDIDIIQWGEIQWKNPSVSGQGWFSIPSNQKSYIELAAASNNAPDLSQVTSLKQMFGTGGGGAGQSDIARFTDPNDSMRSWNTSTITDMSRMWAAKLTDSSLSLDLSQWDVSNVETFVSMFDAGSGSQQSSIGALDISGWNTQSTTDMNRMFYRTSATSITGLGDLNTSLVSNMSQMFNNCPSGVVGQASETLATKMVSGVLRWDVNNVVNFTSMFEDAEQLSDATFPTNWNITSDGSKTVNMSAMFGGTPAGLTNITNLDAFATKTINETWYGGTSYTAWNMSRVSSLSLFAYASGGTPIARNYNIASWQISAALTSMYYMFGGKNNGNGSVWQQDVGHWNVSGLDDGPNKVSYWLSARNGVSPPNMATSIYDSILDITNGWGSQAGTAGFPTNISWQNGSSTYTAGGNAEAGRTALINAGWNIVDGGAVFSNTNALSFNGSSEYINVGEDINSTFQGAFSFSCYIWFNNIDASFQSFLTSGFPVQAYIVNGAVQMYLSSTNSSSTETLPTSSTLTAGEWHHVAFTRSGNGAGSESKIYLNGGVADVTNTSSTIIPLSTSPINIGAFTSPAGSTSLYFNGKIDEVMIWNTVLTQGEVQSYANAVGSGSIPDPNAITGLQMWNRMGD